MPDLGADLLEVFKGKTPEEIQLIINDLSLGFEKFAEKYHVSMDRVVQATKNVGTNMKDAVDKTVNFVGKAFEEIKQDVEEAGVEVFKFASDLNEQLGLNTQTIEKLVKVVGVLGVGYLTLGQLPTPKSFQSLNALISDTDNTTGSLTENVSDLIKILNISPDSGLAKVLMNTANSADVIRTAESSMIQAAAASGQLNEVLGETGDQFDLLDRKLAAYSKMNTDLAMATGLSTSQIEKYGSVLLGIPGALSANISGTADGTQEYSLLDAALKTATGSGMAFKDVFSEITDMYNRFGDEDGAGFQNTLKYVSALQEATNNLKIPLQFIKQYTDQASSAFKFFGNNSEAAIRVIERLGPALKDAKLGPEAIKEMISGITDNVAKMDLASRAFLSQQTGGPGGLRGGYEIELLKAQGKFDEIQKRAEDALRKQFGGRIVTLDEAAKDEGAARQLTKQVQLITSGPTKLVNSEAEAYKFFDIMKKGIESPLSKDSDSLLQENLQKGTDFQQRNNTLLTTISGYAQKIAANTQLSLNQLVRGTIGPGENGDNSQAQFFRQQMGGYSTESANNPVFPKDVGLYQPTANENIEDLIGAGISGMPRSLADLKNIVTSGAGDLSQFTIDPEATPFSGSLFGPGGIINSQTNGVINDQAQKQNNNNKDSGTGDNSQGVNVTVSALCPQCHKDIAIDVSKKEIDRYSNGQDHANHMGHNIG